MKRYLLFVVAIVALLCLIALARSQAKTRHAVRPHHAQLVKHARTVDAHVVIPSGALKKHGAKVATAKPAARPPQKTKTHPRKPRMFTKAPAKQAPNFFQRLFGAD